MAKQLNFIAYTCAPNISLLSNIFASVMVLFTIIEFVRHTSLTSLDIACILETDQ